MKVSDVISEHEGRGRYVTASGVRTFVLDRGHGPAVVCMHGVPASSFLYRKVVDELAERGLRGVAFDLPGLGLAERPADFDYRWTGLGQYATAVIQELGLETFHLVVHDIGGPIGFEVAAAMPSSLLSLTVLNTIIDVDTFTRPWVMEPFAHPTFGPIWLASMVAPVFRTLMYWQGIEDRTAVSSSELAAWVRLLKREDGGRAFLKIMRGFEQTVVKRELYRSVLQDVPYPRQVIWGSRDPALRLEPYARIAQEATGVAEVVELPAKHFLQEDQAPAIAAYVHELAGVASQPPPQ